MPGREEHGGNPGDRERRPSALLYLLRHRRTARGLVLVPPVLLALFALGISVWSCPLRTTCGCRCPGCGLTRAFAALAGGDVSAALTWHPFVFVFALGWVLLAVHLFLPARARAELEAFVARAERHVPISTVLMVGFAIYGVARLVFDACGVEGLL